MKILKITNMLTNFFVGVTLALPAYTMTADTIFTNGKIHTVNEKHPYGSVGDNGLDRYIMSSYYQSLLSNP